LTPTAAAKAPIVEDAGLLDDQLAQRGEQHRHHERDPEREERLDRAHRDATSG
jgi:hypothetical protein